MGGRDQTVSVSFLSVLPLRVQEYLRLRSSCPSLFSLLGLLSLVGFIIPRLHVPSESTDASRTGGSFLYLSLIRAAGHPGWLSLNFFSLSSSFLPIVKLPVGLLHSSPSLFQKTSNLFIGRRF